MRYALVNVVLLSFVLAFSFATEAPADCIGKHVSLPEALAKADVFFVGQVTHEGFAPSSPFPRHGNRDLRIKVLEWWGEPLPSEVNVVSLSPGGGYALDGIKQGDTVTVLATRSEEHWVVGMCVPYNGLLGETSDSSFSWHQLTRTEIIAALGSGNSPTTRLGFSWVWWVVLGVAVATLVLTSLWFLGRGAA